MAASASSQHRCVFVGNIPYDATEEQLTQICEEVGPVVSFRLVVDRETGKPKGYGFCEYKDEETALSARRNLQGYEINGRQLRVDFAENDKNADRNREQGRGGPGLASSTGVSSLHQPIGLPLAANAASIMASALGGPQTANIQSNLHGQSVTGNDPLTHYLSKISRLQLNEIMSEMKALTTQNKPLAQQLLQSSPQLSKALFQAQIMLGVVPPQMMQMANTRQSSNSVSQLSSHIGQASLVNLARPPESMVSQNPGIEQFTLPLQQTHVQPKYRAQLPLQGQLLQGTIPNKYVDATLPSVWSQSLGSLPIQPSLPAHKALIPQSHPSLLQQPSIQPAGANLVHQPVVTHPNVTLQQPSMPHPPSQLPTDVESALLEQVRNLTPEQLSSLPLEQQQQILQLQKMLSVSR